MQQKSMSLIEFQRKFATEKACQEHLFRLRWPDGYKCPRCKHDQAYFHRTRHLYQCKACGYQASVTAGTIFHRTRTPLAKWFWMIFLMGRQKSGISMLSLQRMLEIKTYRTVWVMGHKIRKAMQDRDAYYKLAGLIEMDDSYFGASKPGKRGRGAEKKELVIVAVSAWTDKAGNERPGFAHAFVDENAKADTIENILKRLGVSEDEVAPLIKAIRSDGWRSYQTV